MMKNRIITHQFLITSSILIIGAFFFIYGHFGRVPDIGLRFGYYGEFNQMNDAIERQKNLQVIDFGQHTDSTLEGFWILVSTESERRFTLDVSDSAKIRKPKEKAEGIIVFTGGYMRGVSFPFDSPFWAKYEKEQPKDTETLLSQIDHFLARFEKLPDLSTKLEFEDTLGSIRIRYER